MTISENIIDTEDSYLSLGFNGLKDFTFYDIDEVKI